MAPRVVSHLLPRAEVAGRAALSLVPRAGGHDQVSTPLDLTNSEGIDWEIFTYGLNGVDNEENGWLSHTLFYSLCLLLFFLVLFRLQHVILVKVRRILSLHSNTREALRYWATPANGAVSFIKRHILWAPVGRHKHNREIRLSSVVNFGTLPTRLQAILLAIYFGSNVVYCTILLDWDLPKPQLVAEFRGRTGVMAVVNMVPLFLLAGRNNPLIWILGISFDTWNLVHRWMGRVVALESICHIAAWTVNKVDLTGWDGVWEIVRESPFVLNGLIAGIAFTVMLIHSPSSIRHAAYETFLHIHIAMAVLGLVTLFYHLKIDALPQIIYVIIIMGIWGYDRTARLLRILYRNCGRRMTKFRVVALPGGDGACRVDIEMVRPWKYTPGSHAYVYLPWVSLWQSHPFSIAWSNDPSEPKIRAEESYLDDGEYRRPMERRPSNASADSEDTISTNSPPNEMELDDLEKMASTAAMMHNARRLQYQNFPQPAPEPVQRKPSSNEVPWSQRNTMSMVLSKRSGMTKTLWEMANRSPNKTMCLSGFLEGQYGGQHGLQSYGMVVLVAGGVGITHCIGWVRELLKQWKEGRGVAKKVVLIWVVPDREQFEWCREWFNEIFAVPGWEEFFTIQLYVSRPKGDMLVSPSVNVPAYAGRPDWDNLFDRFVEQRLGTIGVTVCGPGTLSDSIRFAVRKQIHRASIDFLEESFTW